LQVRRHGGAAPAVRVEVSKSKVSDFYKQKEHQPLITPYTEEDATSKSLKFYIETYGCQMNLSDSEIVRSILQDAGHQSCTTLEDADVVLTNTCAVRENAESKVWHRLKYFQSLRMKNRVKGDKGYTPIVGVLGCMAERLKEKLLLEDSVDFVCGPDAYRDMPSLVDNIVSAGQKQANTLLSFDETYADISPVREVDQAHAFVSIMRGCNNMCSFCIVPFTRGRERSRPMASILSEVRSLSDSGVKEVVLLGQNVNGYHDTSEESAALFPASSYQAAAGFTNLYRSRKRDLPGARFADLLHAIADINPDMRVRFTSPHPKDFPAEALAAIAARRNICGSVHLPAQSGSSSVLARMRRGYTREAYLQLVAQIRETIPGVSISTDLIAGFCDETEEEHQDTLALLREVRFDQAFMYAYSLRDRTHAAHTMSDNVPEEVKKRRLQEIIDTYRDALIQKNFEEEDGQLRLVLVEGPANRSSPERPVYTGRTEGNKRVLFPGSDLVPASALRGLLGVAAPIFQATAALTEEARLSMLTKGLFAPPSLQPVPGEAASDELAAGMRQIEGYTRMEDLVGQYVAVRVLKANTTTLRGVALGLSGIDDFVELQQTLAVR
jgi:MiaB/RimO family radical SAM methylthiotransferase